MQATLLCARKLDIVVDFIRQCDAFAFGRLGMPIVCRIIGRIGLTACGCIVLWMMLLFSVDAPPTWSDSLSHPDGSPVAVIEFFDDDFADQSIIDFMRLDDLNVVKCYGCVSGPLIE